MKNLLTFSMILLAACFHASCSGLDAAKSAESNVRVDCYIKGAKLEVHLDVNSASLTNVIDVVSSRGHDTGVTYFVRVVRWSEKRSFQFYLKGPSATSREGMRDFRLVTGDSIFFEESIP